MSQDPYFKKVIPFNQFGLRLSFRVSQDLFSSYDIDVGTRLLLRTIADEDIGRFASILDLGCGYGPIGLTLKALHPAAAVHMVDRDALAVEYSRRNAELNGVSGMEVYGSLGYDDVKRGDFDLIISNIPAKAGEAAIAHFLRDAALRLAPGGLVAVVVVSRLAPLVERVLGAMSEAAVLLRRAREGHTVFHYRFTGPPAGVAPDNRSALERGVYDRGEGVFSFGDLAFPMRTAHNLPEFDSPGHLTELLVEGIRGVAPAGVERALAFNPGQGHAAVALSKLLSPRAVDLVDRDLLALRYSKLNLVSNGFPEERVSIAHQVGIPSDPGARCDLIAGVLREDEGPAAVAATIEGAARRLSPGGMIVLSGGSTAVSRLVAHLRPRKLLRVEDRKKRGGNSLLILRSGRPIVYSKGHDHSSARDMQE